MILCVDPEGKYIKVLKVKRGLRAVDFYDAYLFSNFDEFVNFALSQNLPIWTFAPGHLVSIRTFNIPFSGAKAEQYIITELEEEDELLNVQRLWLSRKPKKTSLAFLTQSSTIEKFMEGFGEAKRLIEVIDFKPTSLAVLSKYYPDIPMFFAEINPNGENNKNINICFYFRGIISALSSLSTGSILQLFINTTLRNIDRTLCDKVRIYTFGESSIEEEGEEEKKIIKASKFESLDVLPSDFQDFISGKGYNPKLFVSVFCLANRNRNTPSVNFLKIKGKHNIENILNVSFIPLIVFFISSVILFASATAKYTNLKREFKKIVDNEVSVFLKAFPGSKVVDPYTQMKTEFMKNFSSSQTSAIETFYNFSNSISSTQVYIDEFSIIGDELRIQGKVKTLEDVETIRSSLIKFFREAKITSTTRSQDGEGFDFRMLVKY